MIRVKRCYCKPICPGNIKRTFLLESTIFALILSNAMPEDQNRMNEINEKQKTKQKTEYHQTEESESRN